MREETARKTLRWQLLSGIGPGVRTQYLLLPFLLLSPAAAHAENLPEPVRAMLETAARSGDANQTAAVAAVARQNYPDSGEEIDRLIGAITSEQTIRRERRLRAARFFQNWSGSGEVGGSVATGNSDTITLAVGLNLKREGLNWQHNFSALADLQRSDGVNSQERYATSYQANWKFAERAYMLGLVGWERNQVAGLRSRFSQALGIGYRMVATEPFSWELEGGPSLRQSDFYDREENSVAMRIASNFGWQIASNSRLTQSTVALLETDNTSLISTTAITSTLWGPVSLRLSMNVQYESDPPEDLRKVDTVSRATLVYEFGGS